MFKDWSNSTTKKLKKKKKSEINKKNDWGIHPINKN